MTAQRYYYCNLCHDAIKEDNGKPGIGVHFGSQGSIEAKSLAATENHVCKQCIRELQRISVEPVSDDEKKMGIVR